jgi:hypothetical protein
MGGPLFPVGKFTNLLNYSSKFNQGVNATPFLLNGLPLFNPNFINDVILNHQAGLQQRLAAQHNLSAKAALDRLSQNQG